jgi:hypothetical protein
MSEPFSHDVFLSHSSKDKATVRALAERLRADGLRVWFENLVRFIREWNTLFTASPAE